METLQKIQKSFDKEKLAYKYYAIISELNDLGLDNRCLELLSFTAIRGSITNPSAKKDFCTRYNTSIGTIYNCISVLTRKNILIKSGNKISIHPSILLDFNNDLVLNICLKKNL